MQLPLFVIFFLVDPAQKFAFVPAMIAIYKGVRFSLIIVWFFAFGGVIGNAIWHPLFALRVGGYFPGLYTSFAYLIVGPILWKRLRK